MAKSIVIVESPAKAKTINKFLGGGYKVISSMGHVIDLPRRSMGVDIEHDFRPQYITIPERKKTLAQLKEEVKDKDTIFLAPDPDREGEAISWHLANSLGEGKKVFRVTFNELTKKAVEAAFKDPHDLDLDKVNAQQARRILDRIVGYSLSPLLWKKVGRGLSAGRVQSVAVRLICEREKEIKAFVPMEYWYIEAKLAKKGHKAKSFIAKLERIDNKKAEVKNKEEAEGITNELKKEKFIVGDVEEKEKKRYPQAPFTTSKLQQEAFNRIRFPAYKTMRIAQALYEGLEIGDEGSVGLITYMRTDSVRVSRDAESECREYILNTYGKDFLPPKPNIYKSKKGAQEAHEAVRPTSVARTPAALKQFLTNEQYKLYWLIWNKFVASQMAPAVFSVTSIDINAGKYLFKVSGSRLLFAGFTQVYASEKKEEEKVLPSLLKDEELKLLNLIPSQHFTEPPPRYTEASLVKALEEDGIGRPSTYAPIIQTIVGRDYVRREKRQLSPTELGTVVTDILTKHFPRVLDIEFTARMEEELDEIEDGKKDWINVLRVFYKPFSERLREAEQNIVKEVIQSDEKCDKCGRPMVFKWGRRGKFLSCSGFPKCKNAKAITTDVECPEPGCDGKLAELRSKKGKIFYGCSNYPKCKYAARTLPKEKE